MGMETTNGQASATREEGENGMPTVVLAHPSGARARVYLQGAHLTSWTLPTGEEMIFVSERSHFGPGKAIRGGVPVIFPQFADQGPLPKHGFARTAAWEVAALDAGPGEAVRARLALRDGEATRAAWPHPFGAELEVALGAETLEMTLSITNPGDGTFAFTAALHTYFRVDDVRRASVEGLRGARYHDKTEAGAEREQTEPTLTIQGETDRVYEDVPGPVLLRGATGGRTVTLERRGFRNVVVWNPWAEGAGALEDMGDDEYPRMLCIEAACAANAVTVAPGETWRGTQVLRAG